ncbi:MAG: Phosphotransferase enzyme family protein [Candidatus Electronema aureum]|uniref:Phosphotransferase enzyme family protein n=1 Tax=Candidatus Electronema aureum TaxID=2005002 RepID=A0A521G1X6_9BACT|nr:MAG: Phosphotransferase enzyme family protein [Candidatus Electronema aureum]
MSIFQQAFAFFLPDDEIAEFAPLGSGRVNDTWLVATKAGKKYVLQRLNPAVFLKPAVVQSNLCRVTEHLQANLSVESGFSVFEVRHSPTGASAWTDSSGAWWRLISYLDGAAIDALADANQAQEIGAALGLFHQLLASLPLPPLADTLPGFHNTPLYLANYEAILPTDCLPEAADCRDFINERRADMRLLEDARQIGKITEQTIHGDPKVGNFLFSWDKKRVISLVDLDTVKPGLLLHDLGDCLRSCCNPLGEEVQNLDEVIFDQELFAAVLAGYLFHAADLLQPGDWQLLVDSVRLMSLELGLRFYSDYLAGSRYFKADHPHQNLFRARVQFALVRSIENQYSELTVIVKNFRA